MNIAATMPAPVQWVERPLEPRITSGCGMHKLGFVPRGGLQQLTAVTRASSSTSIPANPSSVETDRVADDDDTVRGSVTVRGPKKWKSGRPVYTHGNYTDYYGYRLAGAGGSLEDPRLTAVRQHLGDDVFRGKEVLDVGCNSGRVPLAVSRLFGARRVVGQDIDTGLIEAAEKFQDSWAQPGSCTVEFRAEDILESPLRRAPGMHPEKFDIVLCLSVTKWVHFAHGDRGIRNLFKRCFKRARRGGLLVLEPQDWTSYKKKRHLTREIRETVAGIELQPKDFDEYLVSLGFERAGTIEPTGEVTKGFQRRILLFRKPTSAEDAREEETQEDAAEMPAVANTSRLITVRTEKKRKSEHQTVVNGNCAADAGGEPQQKKQKSSSNKELQRDDAEENGCGKSAAKLAGG